MLVYDSCSIKIKSLFKQHIFFISVLFNLRILLFKIRCIFKDLILQQNSSKPV